MKLIKPFRGVPNGEFYPVDYAKGDECPKELEDAAREVGALPNKESKQNKSQGNLLEPPKSPVNNDNPPKQDDEPNGDQSNGSENGEKPNDGQSNGGENGEQN
ncbi:hypothetical protein [Wielerella bovis]|uniref:hypothetical protein n=1 Tax=Wielerella bovis TaxID=2917790 RepID=UPI0020190002|nr:hypothetical protein [Wielerella bovis]ULJ67899.1 hypothetical protein MIS31_04990 [Wielerella bovis]